MKILFMKENREIEVRSATVLNNRFKINNFEYVIDNPHYFYFVNKFIGIPVMRKKILIYKEFSPMPINSENFSYENVLNKEILNDLFHSKIIKEMFVSENKDLIFMIIIMLGFVGGILMGHFL